jgi:hypothetical protein
MRKPTRTNMRTRIQDGTPVKQLAVNPNNANGLLLRAVVINTYVSDDPKHPSADVDEDPVAVYCDVLAYPSISGQRFIPLPKVLVTQPFGGMHNGVIWKPRPSSIDTTGGDLDISSGSAPGTLDGDHVLVGFLHNNLAQPIIVRALPHPSLDTSNADYGLGKRAKLKVEDGHPILIKHQGGVFGLDTDGNHITDTRYSHNGEYDDVGIEPDPSTDGSKGNVYTKLPVDSEHTITLEDLADDLAPAVVASQVIKRSGVTIRFDDTDAKVIINLEAGASLEVAKADAGATLTIGNGAVHAAIAEHVQALWDQFKLKYDAHVHATGTGPSGKPVGFEAPAWNAAVNNSDKLSFPDN